MKKKRNQGFSLVELIVVILILGVLTVALAPQVMRWVGRTRESSVIYGANTIKSVVLVSIGEYVSQGYELRDAKYSVTHSGLVVDGTETNAGLVEIISANMGGDYMPVEGQSGKVYQIWCWQEGRKVDVVVVDGTY